MNPTPKENDRCLKEPDAAGTEDCDRSAGWEGSYRVDHRSAAGRYLCRASWRKHSGRWDCPRGKQCGQRGSTHRREYSADKQKGSSVSAATTNQSGFLRCEATRVGEDTTLSQIIKMVSDAAATKAPIAKIADKVSGVFVPAVITIAVITIMVWLLAGKDIGFALARGISVLVISCPCALGLATPVAIMVGNGMGAKNGILFKNAVALENAGKTQIVALDKTGTITTGEPRVTDILPAEGYTKRDLMQLAADLESSSEHPLAKAVMEHAKATGISQTAVHDFQALPGNGLSAVRGKICCSVAAFLT